MRFPFIFLRFGMLLLVLEGVAKAGSIAITNPGFESNVLANPAAGSTSDNFIAAVGEGQALTMVPGWTYSASQTSTFVSYGGVSDLGSNNHTGEGALDNNIAWFFINGGRPAGIGTVAAQQVLAVSLLADTRYTLTLRVAQSAHAEGDPAKPNPVFPVLGNGVSTGDVFARLKVDASAAAAMPGFLSGLSSVTAPADNSWVTWTLVWETGPTEPLAGQPLAIELFNSGSTSPASLPIEVFFDDIALSSTAVPEPSTLSLLAIMGASRVMRRRRTAQPEKQRVR